ncbi:MULTISPECIES: isoprenyl transferase [Methylomonas]|uniref:Ditrans,polycis-undecaprenyl-diphosphate synthase ((2E,6E)-farnesyl-diphosphate specific) n=2 Tax=Methylomonas TaxID=416 RepID=A0A140E5S0_9GAMM|nr:MULTISPECIES: isoprenyl transferase [Methylomonas]AMK78744.1 UDP pyrophosphate synthase [Methylomonas denitrificans]OAH98997.1 di-trans,poly-cis-decaprenylcistransferase [Methylomonas methanica]TCV83502.1 undecaprenyl pyrophosphate synthetase [Methylomonas methanica]
MTAADNDKPSINNGNPRHIAIIMDGNGRWAQKRLMPRIMGHYAGVKAVRKIVEYCAKQNIEVLSLFAFSSENWRRPQDEVSLLMELFMNTLQSEVDKLDKNNIRLKIIGDKSAFPEKLREKIATAEAQTAQNDGLTLLIAANYGGRWDITQALRQIVAGVKSGEIEEQDISEQLVNQYLVTAELPEPDLFIRSGGEERISNFLLWQLAYTEFYFTDALWPDFDQLALEKAIGSFKGRQRRFGHTGEQVIDNRVL